MNTNPDPRYLNQNFSNESVGSYLLEYSRNLQKALESVSREALDGAARLLFKARQGGHRIFVAGNGGSAAISEHLGCDWQKGVHLPGKSCLKVHCLSANSALLTAIANDFGYDKVFSFQLEMADLNPTDLVVLISSSGNSENILKAAEWARSKGCEIIGLTGFSGGRLKNAATVALHVPFDNYGVVEDAHQALMHILAQTHDLVMRRGN